MNTLRSLTVTVATLLLALLVALPAGAAETPEEKWSVFTRSPHSTVGGFILLACAVLLAAAIINAVQQLRGKRSKADGKFRWR